jgi:hypothetical protein
MLDSKRLAKVDDNNKRIEELTFELEYLKKQTQNNKNKLKDKSIKNYSKKRNKK